MRLLARRPTRHSPPTVGSTPPTALHVLLHPKVPSKLIVSRTKQAIQTQNGSLWRQPRLGNAPFGASPCPAFTIGGWQYTANHTARPITPQFPSRLIVNITKQTMKTQNGSLWRQPRLGDAPFGALPCPAFTLGGWRYTANHTARPITPQFPSIMTRGIHPKA